MDRKELHVAKGGVGGRDMRRLATRIEKRERNVEGSKSFEMAEI